MHRDTTRSVPPARMGYDIFRYGVCQRLRSQEAKAATLDGLGTVAVLVILFFGLMFI
jgi:hypothetical protein